ncbi:hypothetical protein LINPERHAP1_LOCUS5148 [Linum perenne]
MSWTSRWIDTSKRLIDVGDGTRPKISIDDSVASFLVPAGGWDLVRIFDLLPMSVVNAIVVNLGTCSITRVELCGILTSLTLAWDAWYMKVIVKTDSQVVVTLLADRAAVHHHHTLEVIQFREL